MSAAAWRVVIGLLSQAMRRIADGDLNVNIQDDRRDEIAEMSRSLQFFRQATSDAANARVKETEQTRTLGIAPATG